MLRYPVSSPEFTSVGCHEETEVLEAELLTVALEQYFGVPLTVFAELMAAPCHGDYFAAQTKGRSVSRWVW
jgi:hypothetical protein